MVSFNLKDIKSTLINYGFNVDKIVRLHNGTSRNSLLVHIDGEKYILKLYPKSSKSSVRNWITLLRQINSKEEITINPLNDRVLVFGDYVGFLYEFIEGKHYREIRISIKYYNFGKIVGKFNRLTKNMLCYGNSNKDIIKTQREAKKFIKKIDGTNKYFSDIQRLMIQAIRLFDKEYDGYKFRTQLIHGDLHFDNVLYDKKNKKYVIIDTDGLDNGILAREIMVIISYQLTNYNVKNKKTINEFIKGYESEFKLTKKEKSLIPLLMIPRKLGEIMWLVSKLKEGKISNKEFKFFMNKGSVKQLKIILNQFENLKKIFANV